VFCLLQFTTSCVTSRFTLISVIGVFGNHVIVINYCCSSSNDEPSEPKGKRPIEVEDDSTVKKAKLDDLLDIKSVLKTALSVNDWFHAFSLFNDFFL